MRSRIKIGNDPDRELVNSLLKKKCSSKQREKLIALRLAFDSSKNLQNIADSVGRSLATIKRWLKEYQDYGIEAFLDRKPVSGRPSIGDPSVMAFLEKGLSVNRWNTIVEAMHAVNKKFRTSYKYSTFKVWVKKLKGVFRIPRPVHKLKNPQECEAFKRSFYGKLLSLPIGKDKPVKIWFADESRYGLLPVMRRCLSLKGKRPVKSYQTKYEWSYCYGGIDPVKGDSVFIQTPTVNLEWTEAFLLELKKKYPEHEHVVVWDGAGFHPKTSDHVKVPQAVHVINLPAYSPELNPIEKLWDMIQDYTSNKLWPSMKRLDEVVAQELEPWWETPEKVISLFGKNWHRASANASLNIEKLISF